MAARQMKHLFTVSKYKFYWADKGFMYQGLWVWNGVKNFRVLPLNRFKNWTGKEEIVS